MSLSVEIQRVFYIMFDIICQEKLEWVSGWFVDIECNVVYFFFCFNQQFINIVGVFVVLVGYFEGFIVKVFQCFFIFWY